MHSNPCHALREAGTAVWLDQLSRDLVEAGHLTALIRDAALSGVTSNPAIFHKAMTTGSAYDPQIKELNGERLSTERLYEHLAIRDIQMACKALRPVWDETLGADGFVSLEVSPHLARDTEGTIEAVRRLYGEVDRPNLLIKIPGTPEGLPAIEVMLMEGIGINVTLLFSVDAYEAVARTFIRAMEMRALRRQPLAIPSVASFFVSRIDSLVDTLLGETAEKATSSGARDEILGLRGQAAVANARIAYQTFRRIFHGPEFHDIGERGALVQRPLWASTSTKNPAYPDLIYVEPLVGRETVNTLPMETLIAFRDHGTVVPDSVEEGTDEAHRLIQRIEDLGISFRSVTDRLLEEGIVKFNESYDALLRSLEARRRS